MEKSLDFALKKALSKESTLTDGMFYLLLFSGLGATIAIFCITAYFSQGFQFNTLEILGIGLGIPLLGLFILFRRSHPVINLIGMLCIVIPEAIVFGPHLAQTSPEFIWHAVKLTFGITLLMVTITFFNPNLAEHWGKPILIAIGCLIIVRLFQIFIPALQSLTWIDYIGAGIFTLSIGYSMYLAHNAPRTLSGVIQSITSLYLDMINLFLEIIP